MKRDRPKKLNRNVTKHPALRRKWRLWLKHLKPDLTELLGDREIFWGLQDIAKENPDILTPGAFFDWMCSNYTTSVAVGARRFTDQSKNSHSLWVMLYQILANPGVINRRAHISLYNKVTREMDMGNLTFDSVVGKGKDYLTQQQARSDLRKLEVANARIKRFVNKRIAHFTNKGSIRKLPTFHELDNALSTIDEILCKYNLLLNAEGITSMEATRQYDWTEVLNKAWIKA